MKSILRSANLPMRFIRRILNSLRFRLWHLTSPSRHLSSLQRFYCRHCLSPIRDQAARKREDRFVLLTMTGERHIELLVESVASIVANWDRVPVIKIVSDGSISKEDIQSTLAFYPETIAVKLIGDLLKEARSLGISELLPFANAHILGKKLFTILAHGTDELPHLWFDTDILWFRKIPDESIDRAIGRPISLSSDIYPSYAENLLSKCENLSKSPFYNSGLVMVCGFRPDITGLIPLLTIATESPHHFSEQTILAHLASMFGPPVWSTDEIFISDRDEHRIPTTPTFSGKNWIARHYASALKQFWIDAISVRRSL